MSFLPQIKGVKQYLDILFAFLGGKYPINDFTNLLSHGPVTVKLTLSDSNTIQVEFLDPKPQVEVKKLLHIESSVLGATIRRDSITSHLKGVPDVTVDVVS